MNKGPVTRKKFAGANQMARDFNLQAHPLLPSLPAKAPAI